MNLTGQIAQVIRRSLLVREAGLELSISNRWRYSLLFYYRISIRHYFLTIDFQPWRGVWGSNHEPIKSPTRCQRHAIVATLIVWPCAKPRRWVPLIRDTRKGIKEALNPDFLNLTMNREKFWL